MKSRFIASMPKEIVGISAAVPRRFEGGCFRGRFWPAKVQARLSRHDPCILRCNDGTQRASAPRSQQRGLSDVSCALVTGSIV